jgi:hypothetical protein
MYSWICPNSYSHGTRFKVVFRDIQGVRKSLTHPTKVAAGAWIVEARKLLVADDRPVDEVVAAYLGSLTDREATTRTKAA